MADPVGMTRWGPSPIRIDHVGYTGESLSSTKNLL